MEILFENYVTFIDGGTSDGVGFFPDFVNVSPKIRR